MTVHNQTLGAKGEAQACAYLLQQGYAILQRNFRTHYGEIDIIAQKDDVLCFVEVKTRTSQAFGAPRLAVTPKKQQHLIACASQYLQSADVQDLQIRFDVIECLGASVHHIADAFRIS